MNGTSDKAAAAGNGGRISGIDVSFVVSVFNKVPFIPGMIDSLRRQGDADRFEYIFVDDGSTDGSADLIAGLTSNLTNVTVVRQENRGPAIATNVGVRLAHGTYIKLLDADDRLAPGITPLLRDILEATGADLLVGRLATYALGDGGFDSAPSAGQIRKLDDPLASVIQTGLSNTSGTMFRRDAFLAAGGCDETVFIQDFSFFLRMALRGTFLSSDAVIAHVPDLALGRVSGMKGQALHDMNRALLNLFAAEPSIPARYWRLAMRRAAGRTWKWARRHRGANMVSKPFLIHMIGRLPLAVLAPWVLRESCRPFCADPNLRFPGVPV